jgi:hypothetical protein
VALDIRSKGLATRLQIACCVPIRRQYIVIFNNSYKTITDRRFRRSNIIGIFRYFTSLGHRAIAGKREGKNGLGVCDIRPNASHIHVIQNIVFHGAGHSDAKEA